MSGIFKSLQPKDVRVTPYQAYKKITTTFNNKVGVEEPSIKVYDAIYSPTIVNDADITAQTSSGSLKEIDKIFYKNYLTDYTSTPGGGNINHQYRVLGSQAKIISVPVQRAGEGIYPTSVVITAAGGQKLIDDGRGNLRLSSSADPADYDNVLSSYHFGRYYDYIGKGNVEDLQQPITYGSNRLYASFSNVSFVQGPSTGMVGVRLQGHSSSSLNLLSLENNLVKNRYNFTNKDFAIAFGIDSDTNGVIVAKQRPTLDWTLDPSGNVSVNTNSPGNYPFKVVVNGGNVVFTKSDSSTTITLTGGSVSSYADVVVQRSGSVLQVYVNGSLASTSDTIKVDNLDIYCSNNSDIIVGNSADGTQPLLGSLYYLHFFDRHLTATEVNDLNTTNGIINGFAGNIFYNLGLAVVTAPSIIDNGISALEYRSTMTMLETQAYCTIGPGDFTSTYNKSLYSWDAITNQLVIAPKYTGSYSGSYFRPYVTTVGLYNDNNDLVAVAKLSTPIQTSKTSDTTFVVRFDR